MGLVLRHSSIALVYQSYIMLIMKEKFPTKKEGKSKNYSRHEEWESKEVVLGLVLFPVFMFSFFIEDLF